MFSQPYLQNVCTSAPGWPRGAWGSDPTAPTNGNNISLPACDGSSSGNASSVPPYPTLCFEQATSGSVPTCSAYGTTTPWACADYDRPGSYGTYTVCAAPDVKACPVFGAASAMSASFDPTVSSAWPGSHALASPAPLVCNYRVQDFDAAAYAAFTSYPWPTAAMRTAAANNAGTILAAQAATPASTLGLQSYCPIGVDGNRFDDCLVMSLANDPSGWGVATQTWCANNPVACSATMIAGCGSARTPDCACINRSTDAAYTQLKQASPLATDVNAHCWYLPCTGTPFAPYLVDAATSSQPCSPTIMAQICSGLASVGRDGTSGDILESTRCTQNGGVGPGLSDTNSGASPPPPFWSGGSGASSSSSTLRIVLIVIGAALVVGATALFVYWLFSGRRRRGDDDDDRDADSSSQSRRQRPSRLSSSSTAAPLPTALSFDTAR